MTVSSNHIKLMRFADDIQQNYMSEYNFSYLTYSVTDFKKTDIDATKIFQKWLKKNKIVDYDDLPRVTFASDYAISDAFFF